MLWSLGHFHHCHRQLSAVYLPTASLCLWMIFIFDLGYTCFTDDWLWPNYFHKIVSQPQPTVFCTWIVSTIDAIDASQRIGIENHNEILAQLINRSQPLYTFVRSRFLWLNSAVQSGASTIHELHAIESVNRIQESARNCHCPSEAWTNSTIFLALVHEAWSVQCRMHNHLTICDDSRSWSTIDRAERRFHLRWLFVFEIRYA